MRDFKAMNFKYSYCKVYFHTRIVTEKDYRLGTSMSIIDFPFVAGLGFGGMFGSAKHTADP